MPMGIVFPLPPATAVVTFGHSPRRGVIRMPRATVLLPLRGGNFKLAPDLGKECRPFHQPWIC